jgi:NADP-dependent 3-hydroxy acid dehydrogenase YdfG
MTAMLRRPAAGGGARLPSAAVAQRVDHEREGLCGDQACGAGAVRRAISQPDNVDINEILYRPTRQEL